jgi:hypothetical protein
MANNSGHGGFRKGSGRPSKDDEDKAVRLSRSAFESEFDSLEKAFEFGTKQIKKGDQYSFNYFKLLLEYAFGKPKDRLDITSGDETIQNFNLSSLTEKELSVILKLHEGLNTDTDEE